MKNADAITAAADRIKSDANRTAVLGLIDEGRDNANFTIEVEQAADASEWGRLFSGSIEILLASGEYNRHVRAFFARFGINP